MPSPTARVASTQAENRKFGLISAALLLLVFLWRTLHSHRAPYAFLALSAASLAFALLFPTALDGPRRLLNLWSKLMNKITQPIFLGLIFFCVLTPAGLMRRTIRRSLRRAPRSKDSYWKEVQFDPLKHKARLRNQF